jgi:5-(carboxyamino)imidazole ribonucleotide synthase
VIAELERAIAAIGRPAVLKTASFGYDGKGQVAITASTDPHDAWRSIGASEAILEAFIDLDREISVIAARGVDGAVALFAPFENIHRHHILDVTVSPAAIPERLAAEAGDVARGVLESLDYIGILCIEFFVSKDGRLMINELAPRPHNSGHLTIEACATSQFEQQLRAICGLPLGSTAMIQPAAMANLLGDLWKAGEPDWAAALAIPDVKLHLYGKTSARPGRKMGHLTALGETVDIARQKVLAARACLGGEMPDRTSGMHDRTS